MTVSDRDRGGDVLGVLDLRPRGLPSVGSKLHDDFPGHDRPAVRHLVGDRLSRLSERRPADGGEHGSGEGEGAPPVSGRHALGSSGFRSREGGRANAVPQRHHDATCPSRLPRRPSMNRDRGSAAAAPHPGPQRPSMGIWTSRRDRAGQAGEAPDRDGEQRQAEHEDARHVRPDIGQSVALEQHLVAEIDVVTHRREQPAYRMSGPMLSGGVKAPESSIIGYRISSSSIIACPRFRGHDGDGEAQARHGEDVDHGHRVEERHAAADGRPEHAVDDAEHRAEGGQRHQRDDRDDLGGEQLRRPQRAHQQVLHRAVLALPHHRRGRQQHRDHRHLVQHLEQAGEPRLDAGSGCTPRGSRASICGRPPRGTVARRRLAAAPRCSRWRSPAMCAPAIVADVDCVAVR